MQLIRFYLDDLKEIQICFVQDLIFVSFCNCDSSVEVEWQHNFYNDRCISDALIFSNEANTFLNRGEPPHEGERVGVVGGSQGNEVEIQIFQLEFS